jgi:hypothetical protein
MRFCIVITYDSVPHNGESYPGGIGEVHPTQFDWK